MLKNNKIKSLQELLVRCRHRCCICPEHKKAVELAHIKPKKNGGPNKPSNRIPVCRNCHGEIHTKRELTKNYTDRELKKYRENWVKKCDDLNRVIKIKELEKRKVIIKNYINKNNNKEAFEELFSLMQIIFRKLVMGNKYENLDRLIDRALNNGIITKSMHKKFVSAIIWGNNIYTSENSIAKTKINKCVDIIEKFFVI